MLYFFTKMWYYNRALKQTRYASIAQGIEQCPPEACAAVRIRLDV